MITRVVRMDFDPGKVDEFMAIFNRTKHLIRNFPGIKNLELHRDANLPNVFYTYSIWENVEALEQYRMSDLFQNVWKQTKALFQAPPQAFSLSRVMTVDKEG